MYTTKSSQETKHAAVVFWALIPTSCLDILGLGIIRGFSRAICLCPGHLVVSFDTLITRPYQSGDDVWARRAFAEESGAQLWCRSLHKCHTHHCPRSGKRTHSPDSMLLVCLRNHSNSTVVVVAAKPRHDYAKPALLSSSPPAQSKLMVRSQTA